jgi:hypothetical protein
VRTLFDIIDGAKDGIRPSPDEAYFALLALANLHYFDHNDLRRLALGKTKTPGNVLAEESFRRYKAALDADPQRWLGDEVPGNPDYDRFRAAGKRFLERLESNDLVS